MKLDRPISRRSVLARALALGAGAALDRSALARGMGRRDARRAGAAGRAGRRDDGGPRVAIVGAGLAGLTCATRLHQRGVAATVYEAHADRVGGRCWTARGFAAGQTAEHGGEFIDSRHDRIRALCAELGLRLDDVRAARRRSSDTMPRLYLDGALRRLADVYRHEGRLIARADADIRRIGNYHWLRPTRAARELDEMTAAQWLDRALPGAGDRLLRLATEQYMAEEYGLDVDRLSAIAMLTAFGSDSVPSDERFHVHGGNDEIATAPATHSASPAGPARLAPTSSSSVSRSPRCAASTSASPASAPASATASRSWGWGPTPSSCSASAATWRATTTSTANITTSISTPGTARWPSPGRPDS